MSKTQKGLSKITLFKIEHSRLILAPSVTHNTQSWHSESVHVLFFMQGVYYATFLKGI